MKAYSATPLAAATANRAETHLSLSRVLFVCTVILAGALFWIAPRLPMGDLPQHAAQVSLLHDLLTGTSSWQDLVRINYFTPYLLGYGLALGLSFVMPVVTALNLLMMLAYYAFVAGGVLLRKRFDADPRLDWLIVPGFFGMAFQFGFYTFLVAAPLAFFFLLLAQRFAVAPTPARGIGVFLGGLVLFFSHGLVFAFACAIGAGFVLVSLPGPALKNVTYLLRVWTPYILLGLVTVAYLLYIKHNDLVMSTLQSHAARTPEISWDWGGPWGWHRLYNFVLYVFATEMKDWYFLLAAMFMLAAPWLMGMRPDWRNRAALVPMAVMLLIWFLAPVEALKIDYLYQRFPLYLLPAYALMFRRAESLPAGGAGNAPGAMRAILTQIVMVLICWSFLGALAVREHRFAQENASFETLLSATEPGQRALSLVYAPQSTIMHNLYTYHSYPLWYQAERKGFVDFNFAFFLPQIVRFRPDRLPAMRPELELSAQTFDWHAVHGRIYRYFFVRHTTPLPQGMFDNDECQVVLLKEAGNWSLFERRTCS